MIRSTLSPWLLSLTLLLPVAACDGDDGGDSGDDSAADDGGTGGDGGDGDGGGDDGGGGGDDGGGGDGGGASEPGYTDCTPMGFEDTPTTCQPGQYCDDPNLASCEIGCLANVNCAQDQVCDIPSDASIGTCVNQGPTEPAISVEELCEKLSACDPSATPELCAMFHAATNDGCHQCILDENCGDINDFPGACDAACGL